MRASTVGADNGRAAALLGRVARFGFRAVVMDRYPSALFGQAQGDAAANPLGRAGDQHHPMGQALWPVA